MCACNFFAVVLLAVAPSSASGDVRRASTQSSKANLTFVPIWGLAAPLLAADEASNSNGAQLTIRRRRARDRDREVDGYVSDDDRYATYAKLRGAEQEPRAFGPPARAPRAPKEEEEYVVRTVDRDVDTYESDRFERDRFEDDREVRRMNNNRYFRPTPDPVHKLALAVINMIGFGVFGFDRCLMGQVEVGIVKAITLGGCGIWFLVDYVVITVNCLMFWKSVQVVGFSAHFERGTVTSAFWFTFFCLVVKMCTSAYETNRRTKSR